MLRLTGNYHQDKENIIKLSNLGFVNGKDDEIRYRNKYNNRLTFNNYIKHIDDELSNMTQIYSFATIYGYGLVNLSNYIKEKLNDYNLNITKFQSSVNYNIENKEYKFNIIFNSDHKLFVSLDKYEFQYLIILNPNLFYKINNNILNWIF
tara:strand:- start:175 stop:624 length:450 start_codon:yes stop_codon:yes gene_type:complete